MCKSITLAAILITIMLIPLVVLASDNISRGKYFSKKKYTEEALPGFAESKDRLPSPILDANPEWIKMYWKCWEIAFDHFKKPQKGSPLVSNFLDEAFCDNIFQWDTIFMVMFARYGHDVFPAIRSLDNFYCCQWDNGYICREIVETSAEDFVYEGRKNTINPPLFSWAEVESYKITGDNSRFAMVLPVLEKYVEWLNRDGDPENAQSEKWQNYGRRAANSKHHLYWNTGLGSGMDNTPRGGNGWVDMSCQMVIQYNDLAAICDQLGKTEKAKQYRAQAKTIGDRINRWMWNQDDGLYYDVDNDGNQIKWKTSGCFWPMLAGITTRAQSDRLVSHLKDPNSFWRTIVFPTLAADQKGYNPKGGYWLGSVWAPTNLAIIKGLEKCGYEEFAAKATEKYLEGMAKVFEATGTVWENYAPDFYAAGEPSKPDFVGWTGCGPIALLIENVLGLRTDGIRKKLVWHLRRTDRHGIENLKLGNARVSVICEKRESVHDPAMITVNSDRDFELIVIYPNGEKKFKLFAGKQVLKIEL